MALLAVWAVRTETHHVVGAKLLASDLILHSCRKVILDKATIFALEAKASFKLWAHLVGEDLVAVVW